MTNSRDIAPSKQGLGYAWYVVAVLMVCYTLSFIDRQILSLMVGPIKRDLAISDTSIGLLQGLAFTLFYAVLGLPLGRVADTRSRRALVGLGVLVWSVMTVLCSAARSFVTLFLARIGVGVGEAALSPGAFSLIADYFPKQHLGRALSTYSMGIFIGSGLAFIVGGSVVQMTASAPLVALPLLGAVASWRLAFLIAGAPGVLVAIWMFSIKEPARRNALLTGGRPARLSLRHAARQVSARWQSVFGLSAAMMFQSMCAFAMMAWAPAYFDRIHHWTPGRAGRGLGMIILICGCLGMYAGGALADRWSRRGLSEAHLRTGVISGLGIFVFWVPALLTASPAAALAFLAPGFFCLGLPIGAAYAALQLILPNQVRGQAAALFILIFNLGGQTLGPLLPGLLNDYWFHSELMIARSMAITIGFASLATAIMFRVIYSPYRRDLAAMRHLEASGELMNV